MYYYKVGLNEINKYEVSYDKKRLVDLRMKAILDCGYTVPCHYQSVVFKERNLDISKESIKFNFVKQIKASTISYNDSEDIYDFTYEKLIYPDLISIINRLLNDDISVLNENCNYLNDTVKLRAIKEYQSKNDTHDKIGMENILTDNQSSKEVLEDYYKELHNIIKFKLVDTLSIEEYERFMNFFNDNTDNIRVLTLK